MHRISSNSSSTARRPRSARGYPTEDNGTAAEDAKEIVVVADQGDVVGDAEPVRDEALQKPDRQQVVHREHGRRPFHVGQPDELVGRGDPGGGMDGVVTVSRDAAPPC